MKSSAKRTAQRKTVSCCDCTTPQESLSERAAKAGVFFIVIVAGYQLLSQFNLISFASSTENMVGLGTVFVIGVTASFSSCLAMVGGLLLSVSAKWSETNQGIGRFAKFEPMLHFNAGRIGGYFLFGGLTGLLGRALVLSIKMTGLIKIILAVVMILLGLQILRLIPKAYCRIPLPARLTERIRRLSTSDGIFAPFILGGLTYFVPCGFTQSMQVLALSTGNFWGGASIMTIFALGTLPALLGISAASTFASGKAGKFFFTFAGTLSLFLGLLNIDSGLALAGVNVSQFIPAVTQTTAQATSDPAVIIDKNGQQIISVTVRDKGYSKNSFTIESGKSTWIYANAPEGLSGCISSMAIPDFNVSQELHKGENWIGPLKPAKDFTFMCSMGMFRANVHVRT